MADPRIFLLAGEPSGDVLGARLMRALKTLTGDRVQFRGVGGPLMEAEGLDSLIDIRELAVGGIVEILRHVPRLFRRMDDCVAAALSERPDVFVSIDAPSFSLKVSKRLAGQGIPLVHYVAPSVWAWKKGRARRMARFLDEVLCLLPFEPEHFERHGLTATFVGHPAVEVEGQKHDPLALRRRLGIGEDVPLLTVLPGSRAMEVERHGAIFGEALERVRARHPDLQALVPTVKTVAESVTELAERWPVPAHVLRGEADKYAAFAASRAAIAASGTVGIELAIAGTPAVMAYRVSPITAAILRQVLTIKWVSIASLVLDRQVQPECLQRDCRPDKLAATVLPLMEDGPQRAHVVDAGKEAAAILGQGEAPPSIRAARRVLANLKEPSA